MTFFYFYWFFVSLFLVQYVHTEDIVEDGSTYDCGDVSCDVNIEYCAMMNGRPLCVLVPHTTCSDVPCSSGSTCVDKAEGGFVCVCEEGQTGFTCDIELTTTSEGVCDMNKCKGDCNCVPSTAHEQRFQCISKRGYVGENCTIETPSVSCGSSEIIISISSEFFNEYSSNNILDNFMFLSPEMYAEVMHSKQCEAAIINNDTYTIQIPLPFSDCGTLVTGNQTQDSDNITFSNRLWSNIKSLNGLYDMPIAVMDFSCVYAKEYVLVSSLQPILENKVFIVHGGNTTFEVNLELCKQPTMLLRCPEVDRVESGAVYTIGQSIHVIIFADSDNNMTTSASHLAISIERMYLSCSHIKDSLIVVQLVENGCPTEPGFELEVTSGSSNSLLSSHVAFQLPRAPFCAKHIYIHAKIQICSTENVVVCSGHSSVSYCSKSTSKRSITTHGVGYNVIGPLTILQPQQGRDDVTIMADERHRVTIERKRNKTSRSFNGKCIMVGQLKEFKVPNEAEGETFPIFSTTPQDKTGKEGERIEFKCVIEGNPPPKILWRKGQWLQIDDGGRYDVRRNNETGVCTMAIKQSRFSDSGKYKVVIVNDFGEVTFPFTAKIEQERKKSAENVKNFKQQLKHREVKQIKKKTAEEREKEVLEILKTADPKDYEKICIEYGFFDFRMILHKLQAFKKVDIPAPEPEAVKVLKALRHVTVNDEGTAVFEIHLENANSQRHMMWYKDGEVVNIPGIEKRHELRCVGNVYQLIIRNVKAEDAGTYTLDIGGEKFDAVLTIKEQPLEFSSGLKAQTARVHGRCVFECVVTRRSQRVTWMKNGEEIRLRGSTGRIQAVSEAKVHRLIISEIAMQDAGKYSAKLGDLESSAELNVSAAPVRFRQRLTNTEVKEKATATFECSVSTKEIKPVWTINGKEITSDSRYTIKTGDVHKLTIKKVMLSDHNAEIKVSFGDVVSKAELQVNAKPIKVLHRMQDTKCKAGGSAEFSCEIDDVDADAQVQWFKDDQLLKPSKKFEMTKRRGKYFLKLNGVSEADEGLYQFQIRGVRSEAHLTCNDPPVVDKSFLEKLRKNPLKFKAGSTAKIVVPFSGKAATSASWTNGRVTLTERGRFHMENGRGTVTLEVKECKVTDSGTYAVSIFNESGDAVIEIPVKIVDKPPPPSGEIAFSDVIADSVTLSWNPPIDENACVDDYIIEAKDASGRWKPVGRVSGDKTQHKVTGLKEGTPYTFRVKSSNQEGLSDPLESKQVTPTALDVAPQIDPKVIEQLEKNPIFVKAGETATIKVPCTGNSPPSSSWRHNGEEILPVKHHRATKSSSMNDVTLRITKCQASDSGVYEARIFNDVGGVTLKTKIVVLDVPDFSKANIKFDKVTPKEVSMSWDAPEQDGGSPVDSYIIERAFSGSDKFEKIGETKAGSTNYKCTNCEAGVEYVFRVRAVNKQGKSEPATSKPITCGIAVIPPTVSAETIKALTQKPMTVKAGQTCRLKVPYSGGQPPPTITWEKDGVPLKDEGNRLICSSDSKNAQTCIHKCSGQDSGRYVCKLKNEAGEVIIPIDVNVLDIPSKITSPIEFSDISSKGVTINWKAIENDGGSKVTHYVIEKKEEGRKVWSSVGKTSGGDLTSFRAGVPAGKTYKFRIKAVTEVGEGEAKESEAVTVKDPFDAPSAVTGNIELVESTNDSITISWDKVTNDGGSPLKGYYIEKRKKGTSTWSRCNPDKPCKDHQYKSTNLRQDQEYEFRVIAVNAAGEGDPSRASRPITAAVPVAPPGEPSDLEMIDSTNSSLSFSWKGTNEQGGSELLGYDIELKKEGTEEWVKYNDTHITGTRYTVRGLEQGCNYHVRMRSVNVGSYSSYYRYRGIFTAEEMHAMPGFKLTSELEIMVREGFLINAGGTIRIYIPYHGRPRPEIHWTKDGSEVDDTVNIHDVDGVSQLMIRNARGIHSGAYKVTLKNASGSQSLCIKIKVSDVPSAPSGPLEVITTNENITLKWRHSKSGINGDFLGYSIQKREARGRDWQTISQNVKATEYTITDLHKQRSYYLRVQAENNIGKSEPLQTKDMVYIKQAVEKVHIEDMQYDEKDLRKPPLVTVPLRPRNVPDGVKVTLSCSISGKPYPNTRWFKDNKDITEDPYFFKENVIGLCRLVIANVKVSDSGTYKVEAENSVGTAFSEASLHVSN